MPRKRRLQFGRRSLPCHSPLPEWLGNIVSGCNPPWVLRSCSVMVAHDCCFTISTKSLVDVVQSMILEFFVGPGPRFVKVWSNARMGIRSAALEGPNEFRAPG
jgi:hypothetical protein